MIPCDIMFMLIFTLFVYNKPFGLSELFIRYKCNPLSLPLWLWNLPCEIWNMPIWWMVWYMVDERLFNGVSSGNDASSTIWIPRPILELFLFPRFYKQNSEKNETQRDQRKRNWISHAILFIFLVVVFVFVIEIEIEMSVENQVKLINFLCAAICWNWTWDKIKELRNLSTFSLPYLL